MCSGWMSECIWAWEARGGMYLKAQEAVTVPAFYRRVPLHLQSFMLSSVHAKWFPGIKDDAAQWLGKISAMPELIF